MSDKMDELLRDLGRGTPFPVDWTVYEREVLQRLARQQVRRKRRVWWAAAFGTGLGAAATFVAMVTWTSFRPAPAAPQLAAAPQAAVSPATGGASAARRTSPEAPPRAAAVVTESAKLDDGDFPPCIRSIRLADGTVSEIHFAGFSTAEEQAAGMIGVAIRRTR